LQEAVERTNYIKERKEWSIYDWKKFDIKENENKLKGLIRQTKEMKEEITSLIESLDRPLTMISKMDEIEVLETVITKTFTCATQFLRCKLKSSNRFIGAVKYNLEKKRKWDEEQTKIKEEEANRTNQTKATPIGKKEIAWIEDVDDLIDDDIKWRKDPRTIKVELVEEKEQPKLEDSKRNVELKGKSTQKAEVQTPTPTKPIEQTQIPIMRKIEIKPT
jgi:hypothetical protein